MRHTPCFALPILLSICFDAAAATLQVTPVADGTLFAPAGNVASGSGPYLFVGAIASGDARRAVLRFDLSAIPPGSTVQSASLRVVVDRAAIASSPDDRARLHVITAPWGEGLSASSGGSGDIAKLNDVTWTQRFHLAQPPQAWAQAGGDYLSDYIAIGMPGTGAFTWPDSAALRQHIQAWVDNPAANHGWLIRDDEVSSQNAKRLISREGGPEAPQLTVEYAMPAPPAEGDVPLPGWALLALGAAMAGALHRRARPR